MGRGGKKFGRGRGGRGGGRGNHSGPKQDRPDNRVPKDQLPRKNEKIERYYNELGIVPEEEREDFWKALKTDLPNSFRFTGSKGHALAIQQKFIHHYIPRMSSIKYQDDVVDPPEPALWYPDKLAWFMTTPKSVVRRYAPFAEFQKFIVTETEIGNMSRQELVSMIPPLVMDLKPGMTVLDLCAAPGSKSAQLLEMVCAGEEERAQKVADNFAKGLPCPDGEDFQDNGRSTGLLIANELDYKRSHMLVHQMKRLSSPNVIVTQHDATIYPSIKLSGPPNANGKPVQNRVLKFDRILADVPCSGDGTLRKNLDLWNTFTPGSALGLHATQVRILVRAFQMLKVGGRVVYSTCSMNPAEDESVLSAAISEVGGPGVIELMETDHLLPGLKRAKGLKNWKIMDKAGKIWNSWEDVEKHREEHGPTANDKLVRSMFPLDDTIPLERAMRVYAHYQNTGGFFIAILEKKGDLKTKQNQQNGNASKVKVEAADTAGTIDTMEINRDAETVKIETDTIAEDVEVQNPPPAVAKDESDVKDEMDSQVEPAGPPSPSKRKLEETDEPTDVKRVKAEPSESKPQPDTSRALKPKKGQPVVEPFKYLSPDNSEIDSIFEFYKIHPSFPRDRFMVRNHEGNATKNVYYTTSLARDILTTNESQGMKFTHSGVKMFVKQDAPAPDVCPWRIQTEGLKILETWVGAHRIVTMRDQETFKKLLVEMFPRFIDDDWKSLGELGDQMRDKTMGCFILVVEPSSEQGGFSERMTFPLWKSIFSLNLMMPKEIRREMLLRLYDDDSPLVNMNQQAKESRDNAERKKAERANGKDGMNGGLKFEGEEEDGEGDVKLEKEVDDDGDTKMRKRANTSSPEP